MWELAHDKAKTAVIWLTIFEITKLYQGFYDLYVSTIYILYSGTLEPKWSTESRSANWD